MSASYGFPDEPRELLFQQGVRGYVRMMNHAERLIQISREEWLEDLVHVFSWSVSVILEKTLKGSWTIVAPEKDAAEDGGESSELEGRL